ASTFANLTDSYGYRLADWAAWSREGLIDICMPMNFSADNPRVFFPQAELAQTNQGVRYIYVGQAAYTNTPESTVLQLKYVRDLGFRGAVLYSYRSANPAGSSRETFDLLRERFQPNWARTPDLPWKLASAVVRGVVRGADNAPVYNAVVALDGNVL